LSFINRYRIRQLLREIRGNITIVFGLFLAILLMVFGFGIKGTIDNYVKHTTDDAKYRNMYVLQYPENKIPAGGEEAYSESLYAHLDIIDTDLEVSILGIKEDNPYFDFKVKRDIDDVYISNSVAYKFGYKVGENIVLSDHIENRNYSFHVAGIVPYSNGLYIFADMDNMRKVFGKDKNYYNTILSDKKLNIEPGRIASVVTINDIAESASKFNDLMAELIIMLIAVSVIVFILVLYLLLKMMVDKSTFSISLIKVFGYNEKEVKKLYLGSAFYTVLVSSMIGIPISTLIVRAIWPYMISNVAAGFESYIPLSLYFTITGIILASYLVVNFLVGRHLKKVSLVEILKNRE
jgi:putative ABC transport system permease protein